MKKLIILAVSLFVCLSSAYAAQAAETKEIPEFLRNFLNKHFEGYCDYPIMGEKPWQDSYGDILKPPHTSKPEEDKLPETAPGQDEENEKPGNGEATPALTLEEEIHILINKEREKNGLAPLALSPELSSVARKHSSDMAARNYFSHNSPEGITPFDRLRNAGISYGAAAENIAAGQKTAEAVVKAWMNSSGHRKNILNGKYKKTGIGVAEKGSYGIYHTQVFTD